MARPSLIPIGPVGPVGLKKGLNMRLLIILTIISQVSYATTTKKTWKIHNQTTHDVSLNCIIVGDHENISLNVDSILPYEDESIEIFLHQNKSKFSSWSCVSDGKTINFSDRNDHEVNLVIDQNKIKSQEEMKNWNYPISIGTH
jgi:hypothetical protein